MNTPALIPLSVLARQWKRPHTTLSHAAARLGLPKLAGRYLLTAEQAAALRAALRDGPGNPNFGKINYRLKPIAARA